MGRITRPIRRAVYAFTVLVALALGTSESRAQYDTVLKFSGSGLNSFLHRVETLAAPYLSIAGANAAYLGLTDDTSTLVAGMPIGVSMLRVDSVVLAPDSLVAFQSAGEAYQFFRVPLMQGSNTGPSIDVFADTSGTSSFGRPTLTRAIFHTRDSLVAAELQPYNDYFVLDIPGLNLTFVARKNRALGRIYATPIFDYPHYHMEGGKTYTDLWTRVRAHADLANFHSGYLR